MSKCTWVCEAEKGYSGGWYNTDCGSEHIFFMGNTLDYADIKYCPYCGLEIKEEVEVETAKATAGGEDVS